MTLDERIARLRQQRNARESVSGIGNGTPATIRREPSLNEQNATWHKRGYYLFFCIHDKPKVIPCHACGRSVAQAELNLQEYHKQLAALRDKIGL